MNTTLKTGHCRAAKKLALAALLLMPALSGAAELGRLFFTPEQRAQLEYNKLQNADPGDNRRSLTVNGIVQKHGGARTIWVNGIAQPAAGIDDRAPESIPVAIPGQARPVKIKVGQKLLINPPAPEHAASTGQ